ncbi:histidinol phosphate phosphatase [Clostridium sp. HV4-5-A1G]|uniref:histidinol phosphate phosphatase n=1 Tax=Clostridium sp. HV4-5-A1G TaxID=2004595 RepID=UPI001239812E|nr:histidinol phosphate phosphatase [Clostridium sp. HV4-5-A1G]KAA8668694.1 histidinol phosphate phosphatase [Clostridium sp. HV4-5-A1G]
MFDTHVHTTFSTDSDMKIESAEKYAEENCVSLIITEHMDINFPKKGLFCFDVNRYFQEYFKWRKDDLLLGIELGMKEDCVKESKKLIEDNSFDYVIGSIHLIDNMDLYYPDYYKGKTKKEAYLKYLQVMFDNLNYFDFIDSLGHIDYIARYAKYEDSELYYNSFSDIIDEILKRLIEKGICLELNTRRLGNYSSIKSMIDIYRRFEELGGKYITIGSDAHDPSAIGINFKDAVEIAELCNLKIVYFKNRSKEYDKNL